MKAAKDEIKDKLKHEELKLELRKKIVNLFHHPGTPIADKEKLKIIIEKLVEV